MEKGSSSGDSLNGLKFGKKMYFEDAGGSGSAFQSIAEPAAQGKKAKGAAAGGLQQKAPRCQVEGCNMDLTGVKAYYCRHKVCGMHSKSPKVTVAGLAQRFCQQCSRFHLLSEFDQGKRSCRRRLAGHNERRRKPPSGPLSSYCSHLSSFNEEHSKYRSSLNFSYPLPQANAVNNMHTPLFSDSSCALSLLSNHRSPAISTSLGFDSRLTVQPNTAGSYMNSPWAFKDHAAVGNIPQEVGMRQFPDSGSCHFSSELEVALQGNRMSPDEFGCSEIYDHNDNAMNWSI